jgi:hypothetical protein
MNHPTEKPQHRDLGAELPAVTEDQHHIGVALPREGTRRFTHQPAAHCARGVLAFTRGAHAHHAH